MKFFKFIRLMFLFISIKSKSKSKNQSNISYFFSLYFMFYKYKELTWKFCFDFCSIVYYSESKNIHIIGSSVIEILHRFHTCVTNCYCSINLRMDETRQEKWFLYNWDINWKASWSIDLLYWKSKFYKEMVLRKK